MILSVAKEGQVRGRWTYGYRRVNQKLRAMGIHLADMTVNKLMAKLDVQVALYNRHRSGKYSSYEGNVGTVADNLLKQQFQATIPYQVLHTDVSQVRLANHSWAYISSIIDEASKEVLAFQLSQHPDRQLITATLNELCTKLPDNAQPIIHSDQGWHYQLGYYTQKLADNHFIQSMSRKGNCHDNAPMESFFHLFKTELLDGFPPCKDLAELKSLSAQRTIPLRVDTLNNKSVNPRGVFCIVSYSTIEKLKLLHDYQKSDYGLTVYSDYHGVRPANMSKWIKQFLLAGLAGLIRPKHNQKYSLETKLTAVKAYLSGKYTNQAILQQYQIRNISQLHQWVISYNNDKLRVNQTTRKRVRKMGRKVTFDEKRQIVRWTIEHNNNYKAAAEKYDISYQRVYSWVRKYRVNSDWEVLKDNRGRNKGKEPTNELEKLRKRVRELEARDCERELQIAFAKKLVKIRNREVKRPDDIKRFKK